MTTACVIAAVCILLAGLFAVIVERTNERDEARDNAARLSRELEAAEWALAAERDVRRRTEHAFAELQTALSDGRVVMPLRSVRCICGHPNGVGIHLSECPLSRPLQQKVIPFPRAATHDHLAEDDAWFERLYDDKGDLR